jgi:hypothetical protein
LADAGRPAFTLLAFLASMGPALWITALNVKYRDFRSAGPGCQRVRRGVLLVVRHT